jgi:uncharacterized membrane protein YoaK (UPF0700 family)
MFRHQGKNRTLKHNLSLATLLSFVAGMVNVAGFLSVQKLTTNVTGHFAYFVDEIFKLQFLSAFVYFLYIFFFFLGSFVSNLIVEIISKKNENYVYVIPAVVESALLFLAAFFGNYFITSNPNILVFCLLFAMGLQNSLVTTISNAAVRTTHLTGLFTDLGIEISQLFFYKHKEQKEKLVSSIKLRLAIIGSFFFGGVLGGVFFTSMGLHVLIIAATALVLGILLDSLKLKLDSIKQAYKQ